VKKIRNRLLLSLPSSDLALLSRHFREVPLLQGQTLEERGQPVDAVHFPQTGMISLIVTTAEDKAVEVGMVGHEGAVGMMAGLGSRIASIRALVQVSGTALRIPAVKFQHAANQSPRIRMMIVKTAELQLGVVQQTAACNALHDAPSRLCRWLLQTSDKTGSDLIPFTHEFLGQMLGVQRSTVSGIVGELLSAGLIRTQYGEIQIAGRAGLKERACECYDFMRKHVDHLVPRS
jgi:CRP-like cAMP-binding protein